MLVGFIGSILMRPGRGQVNSGSLESFGSALGFVGLIVSIVTRPARRRVRWIYSGAPWGSWCSFGRAKGVVGFIRSVVWFIPTRPGGHQFHSGSLGSFGHAVRAAGFIRVRLVHSCSFWLCSGSFGLVGFTRARRCIRWNHSGAVHWCASFGRRVHTGSLDAFEPALGDLVFIPVRLFHSGVSRLVVFIRACLGDSLVYYSSLG